MQLIRIGLEHPDIRNEIFYGASDNERGWWDNGNAFRFGYRPKHKARGLSRRGATPRKPSSPPIRSATGITAARSAATNSTPTAASLRSSTQSQNNQQIVSRVGNVRGVVAAAPQGAGRHGRHRISIFTTANIRSRRPRPSRRRRAPVADYQKVCERLGIARTVVVQPTAYGTDNRCTLEAIAADRAGAHARRRRGRSRP